MIWMSIPETECRQKCAERENCKAYDYDGANCAGWNSGGIAIGAFTGYDGGGADCLTGAQLHCCYKASAGDKTDDGIPVVRLMVVK